MILFTRNGYVEIKRSDFFTDAEFYRQIRKLLF